jgi:hypothetical protein
VSVVVPTPGIDGRQIGKVYAVHVGPHLVGGTPLKQNYDIEVEFARGRRIFPHWKLKAISALKALALQAADESPAKTGIEGHADLPSLR